MFKKVSHIGIAVASINDVVKFFHDTCELELKEIVQLEEIGLAIGLLKLGETEIELLQSLQPDTTIAKYIEKRGEGLHHIAIEVDDIEKTLKQLKVAGIELVDEKPRSGRGGQRIAFINPKSTFGVLIELEEFP